MKVAIIEALGVSEEYISGLMEKAGITDFTYHNEAPKDVADTIKRCGDADVIVLANMQFRQDVISQCPNIKMISVAFTGVDHVDMAYCKEKGILVSNCSGYSNEAVSELVFGTALTLYRRIRECDLATRQGGTKAGLIGFELSGKKFGVVGTGAIGQKVVALAKAFGCDVYAYSRHENVQGVHYVSLPELMKTCDIVSLHVPLNEATKGLIGKKEIALMKKDAILINAARGLVVDMPALATALTNGDIAGAAIDVFEVEPPIPTDHCLTTTPNTVLLPHVGFATKEALEKRAVIAIENIHQYNAGHPQNVM